MTRPEVTKEILTLTNKAGDPKAFDRIEEKTDSYLDKLLKVVKRLKKQNVI